MDYAPAVAGSPRLRGGWFPGHCHSQFIVTIRHCTRRMGDHGQPGTTRSFRRQPTHPGWLGGERPPAGAPPVGGRSISCRPCRSDPGRQDHRGPGPRRLGIAVRRSARGTGPARRAHPSFPRAAAANTKEQFMHSPALPDELMNAIMDTMAVHQSMSRQALNSDAIRAAMLATMLAQGGLWEAFRQRTGAAGHM